MKQIILFILFAACVWPVKAQRLRRERKTQIVEIQKAGGETLTRFKAELYAKLKGRDESVYLDVAESFACLGMETTKDSIQKVVMKKFPRGILMRDKSLKEIANEKDPVKQEALYKTWVRKYSALKTAEDTSNDYVFMIIGNNYAQRGNSSKAMEFANLIKDDLWMGEGYCYIARTLMEKGDFENTAILSKRVIDHCERLAEKEDLSKSRTGELYRSALSLYAESCHHLGRDAEALEALEKLPRNSRNGRVNAVVLDKMGRSLEAFLCLDEMVRVGKADAEILEMMRPIYVKLNGSEKGFDEHIGELRARREEQQRKKVAGSMISMPAPDFTLTDTEGREVTLSKLRGKVVVLDFWATWCGPCKQSFPAMQKAIDKFRNDPNVEFLFIHTWEREKNATEAAVKHLKDNGYTFHLLMDLKDKEIRSNKVVKSYGVTGIPTKIVIDPQGNIRFKVTGSSSRVEEVVNEISLMIEMARKGTSGL